MKNIKQYILEKFKITKDIGNNTKTLSIEELNDKIEETCLRWAEEFCHKKFDNEDFAIKQNSNGDVAVLLYSYASSFANDLNSLYKEKREKIVDSFHKEFKNRSIEFEEEFSIMPYTNVKEMDYGFKIYPNFISKK